MSHVKRTVVVVAAAALSSIWAIVAGAEEAIEEVVVVAKSIKASQQAAIEAKRNADNVADIISADAVGRFPDQNIADALGRVPGVAIERDQGQARYVSFRGAPKRYTTTAFNGIAIPGVENGRIPRFDAYPAVIIGQVVANKAITADMPGESISGYINVKTFSPSDVDGWTLSVEAGLGEQDLGGGDIEKLNVRTSYSDDRFGFVVYGSKNKREQVTDNREMTYVGTQGALVPVEFSFRNYRVEREDEAYGGSLEFYLDNGSKFYVSSLNTEFTDKEERNQWDFIIPDGSPAQSGTVPIQEVERLLQDGFYGNETDVNTIGADLALGDWDVTASYSRIDTLYDTHLPIPFFNFGLVGDVFYDLADAEEPILTFNENLGDVEYALPLFITALGELDTEADQIKVDVSRANRWGVMKFGMQYDSRDAEGGGSPLALAINGLVFDDPSVHRQGPWETDFNNTVGGYYIDNAAYLEDVVASTGYTRPDFDDPAEQLSIEEAIISAYFMQTIDMDWGNVVLGVRVENTDYETVGSRLVGAVLEPLMAEHEYTNILPNAHVNWEFREDQKLRFSFSTGISRPTYIESRAAASIDVLTETIVGGNPELDEETAWGFDVAYEWYFADASLFSATAFYRSIDNVISQSVERVDGSLYSDLAAPGDLWDLRAFGNGKDGELQGIELSFTGRLDNYIGGFFSGFGVEANVTFIDSKYTNSEGNKFALPGQSDKTYNLSLFYENYGLSARLSYRYRDAWLDETEAGLLGTPVGIYWDEQKRLDLSVRYDLEPLIGQNISLFLDMNNLTDERDIRYTGSTWNPNQVEAYGRRYLVGVRYSL